MTPEPSGLDDDPDPLPGLAWALAELHGWSYWTGLALVSDL